MSVTSVRVVSIVFTGDVTYNQGFVASPNVSGSGQNQLVNLSSGNNTITVPSGAVAVTIIPPITNTIVLKIKGANGDTGIIISPTDPCSISLSGVSSFVINAGGSVTGLRLIYS